MVNAVESAIIIDTVEDLLKAQPVLYEIVKAAHISSKTHKLWEVYEVAKSEAKPYVGWGCKTQGLNTEHAYNLFIDYLLDSLDF